MDPPNDADWRSEDWSPGVPWAYKHFHGRTLEEAVLVFGDNDLSDLEDLLCMPSRVFGFYLRAYLTYLTTTNAINDSDDASRLISHIQFKAEKKREDLTPLWTEVEPVLKRIGEQQGDSPEAWTPEGRIRARIHEIVKLGFEVTFDTAEPDIVPDYVTLRYVVSLGAESVSPAVAARIFRNSGIERIHAASSRSDIIEVLGTPDADGGGDHQTLGHIPEWIRYKRPDCVVHFQLEGDTVTNVTFMPLTHLVELNAELERIAQGDIIATERAASLAAWEALWKPSQDEMPSGPDRD